MYSVFPGALFSRKAKILKAKTEGFILVHTQLGTIDTRSCAESVQIARRISLAQLYPGAPITPPPGWAPAPHIYNPAIGIL